MTDQNDKQPGLLCDDCGLPIPVCNARAMINSAMERGHSLESIVPQVALLEGYVGTLKKQRNAVDHDYQALLALYAKQQEQQKQQAAPVNGPRRGAGGWATITLGGAAGYALILQYLGQMTEPLSGFEVVLLTLLATWSVIYGILEND